MEFDIKLLDIIHVTVVCIVMELARLLLLMMNLMFFPATFELHHMLTSKGEIHCMPICKAS